MDLAVHRFRGHRSAPLTGSERVLALCIAGMVVVTAVGSASMLAHALAEPIDALHSFGARADMLAALPPDLDTRSKIYARDGTLLAILHGEENREPIRLQSVPRHVRDAVVAAEDQRFFRHDGVDPAALGRALVVNTRDADIKQGGGTLTMQLARNAYLRDRRRTWERKWGEILVARRLEARMSKDEILEQYLNTVYFGAGAWGLHVAAEAYFGKRAGRLTVSEAALLAGLIRAPASLNPWKDPGAAKARRDEVLAAMHRVDSISGAQLRGALTQRLTLRPRRVSNGIITMTGAGRSFVEYVKQQLLRDPRLGETKEDRVQRLFTGGLRIDTTLDLSAQRSADASVAEVLDRPGDPSAALVAIEPSTGAIRAMVGGDDPLGFNLATQGRRQPGSAFKPFTLVAALENGISAYDVYNGSSGYPISLPGGRTWFVRNYSGSPGGMMTLLDATRYSVNAVYAQVAMRVGPARVADVARRMGITSKLDTWPSISLGALTRGVSPLEMASAYATLANRGVAMRPLAVTAVRDRAGAVVLQNRPRGRRAVAADVAVRATVVLEQVIQRGSGRRALALNRPAAGKTGTTDEYRDSWFVGFTPQLSTAVWLGYPRVSRPLYDIRGLPQVYGGSLPCEIWTRFMIAAHRGLPVLGFPTASLRERTGTRSWSGSYSASSGSGGSSGSDDSTGDVPPEGSTAPSEPAPAGPGNGKGNANGKTKDKSRSGR